MRDNLSPSRLTIAMWDFSWLYCHYKGGAFEDFDKVTDELGNGMVGRNCCAARKNRSMGLLVAHGPSGFKLGLVVRLVRRSNDPFGRI